MKIELEVAITLLAQKITKTVDANEALKYTQAALNMAHTAQVIRSIDVCK